MQGSTDSRCCSCISSLVYNLFEGNWVGLPLYLVPLYSSLIIAYFGIPVICIGMSVFPMWRHGPGWLTRCLLIMHILGFPWSTLEYRFSPCCVTVIEPVINWLLRQKAITTPMCKSLDKQYRDTYICQWKLHSYLYLSMKKCIGNIVCLSSNINR